MSTGPGGLNSYVPKASVEMLLDEAEAAMSRGDVEKALQTYNRAISEDPSCEKLYASRASALLKMNRLQEALDDAFTAKRLSGDRNKSVMQEIQEEAFGQEEEDVLIRFRIKTTHPLRVGECVYIAGNHAKLGGWDPEKGLKLQETVDGSALPASSERVWEGSQIIDFKDAEFLLYKYVTGYPKKGKWRWEDKVKLRSFSSREREMLKQEKARMQEEKSNVTVFIKDDGQFNTFNDEDEETPSSQQGSGSKQQQDHQLTVKDSPSTASVSFQIQVETQFGDEVYICGSCPELGSWVPAFSKKLMTNKEIYPIWFTDVQFPVDGNTIKYKYLIRHATQDEWTWEESIHDREILPIGEAFSVNDGRFNVARRQITFQKLRQGGAESQIPIDDKSIKSQILTLEKKNAALEADISELQKKHSLALQEVEALRAQSGEEGAEVALGLLTKVQSQLSSLETARSAIEKRTAEAKMQIRTLNESAIESKIAYEKYDEEINATKADCDMLATEFVELQHALKKVVEDVMMKREALQKIEEQDKQAGQELRMEVIKIGERINNIEVQLDDAGREELKHKVSDLELQVKEAESEQQKRSDQQQKNIDKLKKMHEDFQSNMEAQLSKIASEEKAAEINLRDIETEMEKVAKELDELQLKHARANNRTSDLVRSIEDLRDKLEEQQKEEANLDQSMKSRKSEAQKDIEDLSRRLKSSEEELALLKLEEQKNVAKKRQSEQTLLHLKGQILGITRYFERTVNKSQTLETEVQRLQQDIVSLECKARDMYNQSSRIQKFEADKLKLSVMLADAQTTHDELNHEFLQLKSRLNESEAKLLEVEKNKTMETTQLNETKVLLSLRKQNVSWLSGNVSQKIEQLQEKKYLLDSINIEHDSLHQKIMEVQKQNAQMTEKASKGEVPKNLEEIKELTDEINEMETLCKDLANQLGRVWEDTEQLNATIIREKQRGERRVQEIKDRIRLQEDYVHLNAHSFSRLQADNTRLKRELDGSTMELEHGDKQLEAELKKKEELDYERQKALNRAIALGRSAEQGREVLLQIQEALKMEQQVLDIVKKDLEKARLKTSRAQRNLQEFEQKREHLDFMVHRAQLERDQTKEKFESIRYVETCQLIANLTLNLKQSEEKSLKLAEELEELQVKHDKEQQEFDMHEEEYRRVSRENQKLEQEINRYQSEADDVESHSTSLLMQLDNLSKEELELGSKLSAMEKKLAHLDAKNGYLESEAGLLRKEVAQLEELKQKKSSGARAVEESKPSEKSTASMFSFEIPDVLKLESLNDQVWDASPVLSNLTSSMPFPPSIPLLDLDMPDLEV